MPVVLEPDVQETDVLAIFDTFNVDDGFCGGCCGGCCCCGCACGGYSGMEEVSNDEVLDGKRDKKGEFGDEDNDDINDDDDNARFGSTEPTRLEYLEDGEDVRDEGHETS